MSGFPGTIYDVDRKSLDPAVADLLQEQINDCHHCSMVPDRHASFAVRIWLLANNATPDAIPPAIMIEAVKLVLAGRSIIVLAQRLEPVMDVREGLLRALDLFTAPDDMAGHG